MNSSCWLRTFVRGRVNACGTDSRWNAGGKTYPLVKNHSLLAGSLCIAPGSGLKTEGACVGTAELVVHFNCIRAFGMARFVETGGTPASGLNCVGTDGVLLVLMI